MGFSLNVDDLDSGPVIIITRKPSDNDAPDGSVSTMTDTRGQRSWQWGVVSNLSGDKSYRFMTDQPIDGLGEGDMTIFVVIERKNRGRGNRNQGLDGRAFIIDKY